MSKPSTSINQLHLAEARWFAVYTGFKREKLVRQRLQTRGIESYLPLQRQTRYYTRKIRHVDLPLISCYVFVKIVRKEYVPVLEDPDVLYFVKQRSDLIAIPEREIDILKAVTGEHIEVEVTPIAGSPIPGDEVEIIKGRLYGLKGLLIEQQNNRKVVIELEQLGLALRLQLPVDHVRPTGNRKNVPGSSPRLERRGLLDRF
jgi:transcription antitermination factor NusG